MPDHASGQADQAEAYGLHCQLLGHKPPSLDGEGFSL
jgi:hypothetical protein